jgi:hypothetical protein
VAPETGFFVAEAKPYGLRLEEHRWQALAEMYGCAKSLKCVPGLWLSSPLTPPPSKDVLRGALTNGLQWMFLILKLNPGIGGTFKYSGEPLGLYPELEKNVFEGSADRIAGILSFWVSVFQLKLIHLTSGTD